MAGHNLNVLWAAESYFVAGSGIKAHTHAYYHLFVVRRGPIDFVLDKKVHTLQDSEAILAKPEAVHGLRNEAGLVRCYEVKLTAGTEYLQRLLDSIPSCLPADAFAEGLVRELVQESARAELSSPTFLADYLAALLSYYYRKYAQKDEAGTSVIDVAGYSDVSRKIVQYLEDNYHREVPLQEVADMVDLNKNYVCSLFKRDTGITIGTSMTIIRIHKAAELISFSDLNLSQVAESTGFSNLSHFNRVFKKVVGIPPGQYRRMFTADQLILGAEEQLNEVLSSNSFIASVLGRKRLTIAEILEQVD